MFIPETIDLGESEKYVLSIRIMPDEFMFAISEPNVGKNFCLRKTKLPADGKLVDKVKKIIFDFNFLTQEFLQTNVVFVTPDYDYVPAHFYQEKEKETLYNHTHYEKAEHVVACENKLFSANCLAKVDEDLFHFLNRNLSNPDFYHHTSLVLDFIGEQGKIKHIANKMFLNFHHNLIDVITFAQSEFQHCLTYDDNSAGNLIYYILNIWEKSEFDQTRDELIILGKPDNDLLATLGEYIQNINHQQIPSEIYLWNEDALNTPLDLLSLII